MESTSDERTTNNVMRHEYRKLSDLEKLQIELCQSIGHSRELSVATTKAEEAVMWAVKHVTK